MHANIYRKVSRAIFDFSPEQQKNMRRHCLALSRDSPVASSNSSRVTSPQAIREGQATAEPLGVFERAFGKLIGFSGTLCNRAARIPTRLLKSGRSSSPHSARYRSASRNWQSKSLRGLLNGTRVRNGGGTGQLSPPCGARRPAMAWLNACRGPDQTDQSSGKTGQPGGHHCRKGTRRAEIRALGECRH